MSGIYIPGMEMPISCMLCPFCVEEADPANGEMCMVTGKLMPPCTRERLDDCPLIPVPEHGDLIERSAAYDSIAEVERAGNYVDMDAVDRGLDAAPTIIPADKEEQT